MEGRMADPSRDMEHLQTVEEKVGEMMDFY
jgi:hypothetical protein